MSIVTTGVQTQVIDHVPVVICEGIHVFDASAGAGEPGGVTSQPGGPGGRRLTSGVIHTARRRS